MTASANWLHGVIPDGVPPRRPRHGARDDPELDWDGYVHLAFDEIRLAGAGSPQIARRLRAALDDLLAVAPADRRPPLQRQLALLDEAVHRVIQAASRHRLRHGPGQPRHWRRRIQRRPRAPRAPGEPRGLIAREPASFDIVRAGAHGIRTCGARPPRCCRRDLARTLRSSPVVLGPHAWLVQHLGAGGGRRLEERVTASRLGARKARCDSRKPSPVRCWPTQKSGKSVP